MNRKVASTVLLASLLLSFLGPALFVTGAYGVPEIQWSKNYNGFNGWKTIQTSDGGFAIAEDTLDHVPMVIKVDADGNRQWEKTYYSSGYTAFSIAESRDDGYMLITNGDLLLKLDSEGK